jgi:uncharacterized protein YndB with AHSA1/START domain
MTTRQQLKVVQDVFIEASPETVWEFVATEDGIKQWLGPRTYHAHKGAAIDFHVKTPDDGEFVMSGEVVTFNPPHELAFTWTQETIGGDTWPEPTLVTITLEPKNGGTYVKLVHSGFEKLPVSIAREEYDGYVTGWEVRPVLQHLKTLVESKNV